MLVYGSVGLLLVRNRVRDPRAFPLGAAFILVAAAPSDRLFASLQGASQALDGATYILSHLHPDAFLPLCFWLFFGSFPRAELSPQARRVRRAGVTLSALGGILLFAAHASPLLASGPLRETLGPYLERLQPSPALYLYTWAVLIGLTIPSVAFAVWQVRSAPPPERRRAGLFLAGIIAGSLPMYLVTFLRTFSSSLALWFDRPEHAWIQLYLVRLALLTIPLSTAYAVLVHHVLDVRLVVRRAIQYALARYAVLGATAVPFVALVVYVYRNRGSTIEELLAGTGPLFLAAATLVGLVMLQLRQPVLAAIDRYFFREHYDARRILTSLVEGSRRAASPQELAELMRAEIDRALHLERIEVLVLDATRGELRAGVGTGKPLPAASPLATLTSAHEEPLEVDWDRERSSLLRLPDSDREWLRQSGFRLLVPILASEGTLVGIVALGPKRSELPFTAEDRVLLSTIAGSAGLTLENRIKLSTPADWGGVREPAGDDPGAAELALECEHCGRMAPPGTDRCPSCDGGLRPASVPFVLGSKFRFEQRIGAGGMGVVYRAVDLNLGRRVAIKALSRISMELSSRLRREARAMASVAHENLALVYGVEVWRGSPLLVVELLEGGTLSSRIRARKLDWVEGLDLGIVLADTLGTLHDGGVLHRDIKPSNVGYTSSGVPKLLDFGLAKILDDSRLALSMRPDLAYRDLDDVPLSSLTILTVTRRVVGTPIYLSPEAARGDDPDPLFDLWALAVLLFEAVSGTHPLRVQETAGLRHRILEGDVADIRSVAANCPDPVAKFFATALARDPSARPRTAGEFRERLSSVKERLLS